MHAYSMPIFLALTIIETLIINVTVILTQYGELSTGNSIRGTQYGELSTGDYSVPGTFIATAINGKC